MDARRTSTHLATAHRRTLAPFQPHAQPRPRPPWEGGPKRQPAPAALVQRQPVRTGFQACRRLLAHAKCQRGLRKWSAWTKFAPDAASGSRWRHSAATGVPAAGSRAAAKCAVARRRASARLITRLRQGSGSAGRIPTSSPARFAALRGRAATRVPASVQAPVPTSRASGRTPARTAVEPGCRAGSMAVSARIAAGSSVSALSARRSSFIRRLSRVICAVYLPW